MTEYINVNVEKAEKAKKKSRHRQVLREWKTCFKIENVNQLRERADETLTSAHLTVESETTMFTVVQIENRYKCTRFIKKKMSWLTLINVIGNYCKWNLMRILIQHIHFR